MSMASHVCFIVKGGHQSPLLHGELEARAGQGVLQVSREGLLDGCGVIGFLTDGLKSRPPLFGTCGDHPGVATCCVSQPGKSAAGRMCFQTSSQQHDFHLKQPLWWQVLYVNLAQCIHVHVHVVNEQDKHSSMSQATASR